MTTGFLFPDLAPDMYAPAVATPPAPVAPPTARARAIKAAGRAVAHANRRDPGWLASASAAVLTWAGRQAGPWLLETAREAVAGTVAAAPDCRAWGGVAMTLAKRGAIVRVGYAPAESSNGAPKALWMVTR